MTDRRKASREFLNGAKRNLRAAGIEYEYVKLDHFAGTISVVLKPRMKITRRIINEAEDATFAPYSHTARKEGRNVLVFSLNKTRDGHDISGAPVEPWMSCGSIWCN